MITQQYDLPDLAFGASDGDPWTTVTMTVLKGDDGALKITLDSEYEPLADVSVNVSGYAPSMPGAFLVKDYSENTGLADALVAAGVITLTGEVFSTKSAYVTFPEAVLTPAYIGN